MTESDRQKESTFRYEFTVPAGAIDVNRHVNNVAFVQWMQDAAVRHSAAVGATAAMHAAGGSWVVRRHEIEYVQPAFLDQRITVLTWVENVRRVRSLRRYRFLDAAEERELARGVTEWVYVSAATGRPAAIPASVRECFPFD